MTAKINLSELGATSREDFDLCVRTYVADLRAHDEHHKKIAAGSAEHAPYPPPWTLPVVQRAVRLPDIVADYEIVDDLPPPLTPEERRQALRAQRRHDLGVLEAKAREAVIPSGKLRLRNIQARDILAAEGRPSKKDAAFLKDQDNIATRLDTVARHGAKLEAQLEDLDEEDLKSWTPEPFPG